MSRKHQHDSRTAESLAENMLTLLPLARKRLLRLGAVQKKHHLPYSHLQVLSLIDARGPLPVSEISSRLGIAKPNITPLVDRLSEAGFVIREHDADDRRIVKVSLLPAGREKLREIREELAAHIIEQARLLSSADFRELSGSIASIARILNGL